ncbi:hypothetical protein WJX72_005966 [[Myrmecia] bisecta]|uniref:Protein AAR2 homolog n=1 Tax=[Myrmecia] bisecta TaxID=41462 RepID=A0AAW1R622_9CHLO
MTSAPYAVELDQDTAKELVRQGGTLLLLDVPEGTHLGIDQQSFVVGPKFKGVKMLPPGAHLVSYNAASKQGEFAPTTSFFVVLRPQAVVVRRWNTESELLDPMPDEDEVERYAAGVRRLDFDASLAPYDLRSYPRWKQLSQHITQALVAKLAPAGHGNISITAEAAPSAQQPPTAAEERLEAQLQRPCAQRTAPAGTESDAGPTAMETGAEERSQGGAGPSGRTAAASQGVGRCFYTHMPRLVKASGLTSEALTAANLDKSQLLDDLISKEYSGHELAILGETQFAFLAFLMGQSLEGFAQWKDIVHLMLGCEAAPLRTRSALFERFLGVLCAQLAHALPTGQAGSGRDQASPFGLPVMEELMADSFLKRLLARFFEMLHEAGGQVPAPLDQKARALQKLLDRQLGWRFGVAELDNEIEEEDEDAPVVVDLSDTVAL